MPKEDENNKIIPFLLLVLLLITLDKSVLYPYDAHATAQQLLSNNTKMHTCIDRSNGFKINFPSNWTNPFEEEGTCTFFSPTAGKIFPDPSQAYVRISYTSNFSVPMSSVNELANNVIFFTNHGFFRLQAPPNPLALKVGNAVELDYTWDRSINMIAPPQTALPFVNTSLTLPTIPVVIPYGATATAVNQSSTSAIPSSSKGSLLGSPKSSPTSVNASSPQVNASSPQVNASSPQVNASSPKTEPMTTAAIYLMNKNRIYVIEYTASQDIFIHYLPMIRDMINSFAFVIRSVGK